MGCLIFSILGLLVGIFLVVAGTQPDLEIFSWATFTRFSSIILIAICGMYLVVRLVRKVARDIKAAESKAVPPPPVQPSQQRPPPPQSRARSGVFLPQALPEQRNQTPRQEGR